jgi:hypothetical protein
VKEKGTVSKEVVRPASPTAFPGEEILWPTIHGGFTCDERIPVSGMGLGIAVASAASRSFL